MLMPAIALWIVWRLSADYLDIEKRVAGLALLMLVPFFNFHALKFNVNTVLMPLWAATTLWFLRSYRDAQRALCRARRLRRRLRMLGKYWSVFLLAGLSLAALIDRRRVAYFKSPAPVDHRVVGLVVLSAASRSGLQQHDFAPFTYAIGIHGDKAVRRYGDRRARLSRRLARLCRDCR